MAQKNSVTQKSASKHFASFQTKKKLGCIEMVKIEDISNIKNHKKSENLFFSFVSEHCKTIWQKIKTTLFEGRKVYRSLTRIYLTNIFLILVKSTKSDCIYYFPMDFEPNEISFGKK